MDFNTERPGGMMLKKIIAVIAVLAVAAGCYFYLKPKPKDPDLKLYGNIEIRQADLGFKVAGRIAKLYFQEGDSVKKGDLLAVLDTTAYRAQLNKAAADVQNAQATQNTMQANYARRQALYAQGAVAQEEVELYRKNADNAAAQLESLKQAKIVAADSLKDTNLYAPSDGIITSRVKEEGSIVNSNTIIYTLALTEPLWVRTYVSESELGNIAYGTAAKILTDTVDPKTGNNKTYSGHIGYISPTAEFTPKTVQTENLRTDLVYRVRVYIDSKDEYLRQGMPVTVKIAK